MLKFTKQDGPTLTYTVTGHLNQSDLNHYYRTVNKCYRLHGKLHLIATANNFRGYAGPAAVWAFLKGEPTLLWKIATYTLYTEQRWLRQIVNGLDVLTPGPRLLAIAKKPPAVLRKKTAGKQDLGGPEGSPNS